MKALLELCREDGAELAEHFGQVGMVHVAPDAVLAVARDHLQLGGGRSRVQHAEKLPCKTEANALILLKNQADLVRVGQHTLEQRVVSKPAVVEQPMREGVLLTCRLVGCDGGLVTIAVVATRRRLVRLAGRLISSSESSGSLETGSAGCSAVKPVSDPVRATDRFFSSMRFCRAEEGGEHR